MATSVKSYTTEIPLKIKPWGKDSPLPNLYYQDFLNIYPYNTKDDLDGHLETRIFKALVLENEYLVVTIVPELGVRLFSLYDKIARREIFNMPEGVFPSIIYLRGIYFPVGVEFNFPQGHSVHAAEPLDCAFASPSAIVMSVFNAVTRIAAEIKFSLEPGERLLHTALRFRNTLPVRNGFMYWANAGVEQTPRLTFQGKAPMSHFFDRYTTFPYVDGRDFRIAENRKFASDLFAIGSKEEWFGFYCPEKDYGCVHLSPRSQMLGKKFFSWGFDDYAFRWGRHYGCGKFGYVEFQAGILETQFEHTHLEPFEEKTIDETWFPYTGPGEISHADHQFIFSTDETGLRCTASKYFDRLEITVESQDKTSITLINNLQPGQVRLLETPPGFSADCFDLRVADADGGSLVDKRIEPVSMSSPEEIRQKQEWLDLAPVDDRSKLERAFRLYKGRAFDASKDIALTIGKAPFHTEAQRLLAEIDYLLNEVDPGDYPAVRTPISSPGEMPTDLLAAVAHVDALVQNGQPRPALDFLVSYGQKNECIVYLVRYLKAILHLSDFGARNSDLLLDYANPFTLTERKALEYALGADTTDGVAAGLLGNYWSRLNVAKAAKYWEESLRMMPNNFFALRNLAYVTMRERKNIGRAVDLYRRAVELQNDSPHLIVEYIQALRLNGQLRPALEVLTNLPPTMRRDYRIIKNLATLLRDNERFQEAIDLLLSSDRLYFWEGEHDSHRCYLECLMALGNRALAEKDFTSAKAHFEAMLVHPEELTQAKSYDENESAAYYHLGLLMEATGDKAAMKKYYGQAVDQPFPNNHHAVSYRENEYFAARAAEKIGDSKTFDNVAERLTAMYSPTFEPWRIDFRPVWRWYADNLAAARGFILVKDFDKAKECLERIKIVYGECWPVRAARQEF